MGEQRKQTSEISWPLTGAGCGSVSIKPDISNSVILILSKKTFLEQDQNVLNKFDT